MIPGLRRFLNLAAGLGDFVSEWITLVMLSDCVEKYLGVLRFFKDGLCGLVTGYIQSTVPTMV